MGVKKKFFCQLLEIDLDFGIDCCSDCDFSLRNDFFGCPDSAVAGLLGRCFDLPWNSILFEPQINRL